MNRAEKRRMMKMIPGYKETLKSAAGKAVDDLEKMFKQRWNQKEKQIDGGEDGIYKNGLE